MEKKEKSQSYEKGLTPTENSKKQSDTTKPPPKTSITQRCRADSDNSNPTGVFNRFTGSQPSNKPQKLCNQKGTHLKISAYRGQVQTADPCGEAIQVQQTDIYGYTNIISKINSDIR